MRKLTIETKSYKGIPYNEYSMDNTDFKGLVFVQHGFQSTKEYGADYLALTLARRGHKVVAIDAYKHGERIEEPYITGEDPARYAEIFDVVEHTAKDIVLLYEGVFSTEFKVFDMIGVSMGGFIAYSLALKTDKINKLVPTITTPMFSKLARVRENMDNVDMYRQVVEAKLPFIDSIDPYSHMEKMNYKKMLILNGDKDPLIPVEDALKFFHELNDCNAKIHIYDEVHEVNRQMQKEIFNFITNEKAVL